MLENSEFVLYRSLPFLRPWLALSSLSEETPAAPPNMAAPAFFSEAAFAAGEGGGRIARRKTFALGLGLTTLFLPPQRSCFM